MMGILRRANLNCCCSVRSISARMYPSGCCATASDANLGFWPLPSPEPDFAFALGVGRPQSLNLRANPTSQHPRTPIPMPERSLPGSNAAWLATGVPTDPAPDLRVPALPFCFPTVPSGVVGSVARQNRNLKHVPIAARVITQCPMPNIVINQDDGAGLAGYSPFLVSGQRFR